MVLVIFGDIQANPWALDAILTRAKRLHAEEVFCLGNAVGSGPDPAATVEAMRKRHVTLIRGPKDDAALGRAAAVAEREEGDRNARRLAAADLSYLRNAGPARRLTHEGRSYMLALTPAEGSTSAFVIHAGREAIVEAERACPGPAGTSDGEASFLVVDEAGVRLEHVAWDVEAFAVAASQTRHS